MKGLLVLFWNQPLTCYTLRICVILGCTQYWLTVLFQHTHKAHTFITFIRHLKTLHSVCPHKSPAKPSPCCIFLGRSISMGHNPHTSSPPLPLLLLVISAGLLRVFWRGYCVHVRVHARHACMHVCTCGFRGSRTLNHFLSQLIAQT